jgi:ribosomal protein S18 acetylase RimI-like enzyme
VDYRRASSRDAEDIAALHADSWRRNYRGAYSDAFLDGDVLDDRRRVWTDRLTNPRPTDHTIVADSDGVIVGFAHTALDDDPAWGALLDNLHVANAMARGGIGARLLAETAAVVVEHSPDSGLYLWVLERNAAAQAFYERMGGRRVERAMAEPTGGGDLIPTLRYAWPEPSVLLGRD